MEAAGRDTKWNAKRSELPATRLSEDGQSIEASLAAEAFSFFFRAFTHLRFVGTAHSLFSQVVDVE
jgi:hypothetical protein